VSPGPGRSVDLGALSPAMAGFWTERHLCTLTTLRSDGTPHVVPVGVALDPDEGCAWVIASRTSRKVRNVGEHFSWQEPIYRRTQPGTLYPTFLDTVGIITNPLAGVQLPLQTDIIGETNAFKTSTGAEIRFFMPVLNVPFRLIFAHNGSRVGVLDNNFQPAKRFTFRFAVGTTF